MLAITTFPPNAWNVYAKFCTERMVSFWPGPVRVYYEGQAPPPLVGAELRPLDSEDRTEFLKRDIPARPGFLWAAKRFCHKVFAQLDAANDGEPFWWIDADVALIQKVPESLTEQDDVVTFLGRDSYTETGLVGFNVAHSGFDWFARRYRSMYTDGTILELDGWTDCHAFDAARAGRGKNLTPNGKGFDNVMRESVFSPYMAHFKGPLKMDLYRLGGANVEIPAGVRLDRGEQASHGH